MNNVVFRAINIYNHCTRIKWPFNTLSRHGFPRFQIAFFSFTEYSFFCKLLIVSLHTHYLKRLISRNIRCLNKLHASSGINSLVNIWRYYDATTLLSIWHLYESHAKNLLPKEKVPRTFLMYSIVKSLFIQPLDEVTITHWIHHWGLLFHVFYF